MFGRMNTCQKMKSKRQKPPEDGFWECSVCTYRNSPEAYKCDMCDIRKGTSTRKPRLNSQLVAQQAAQQFVPTVPKRERNSLGLDLGSDFDFSDNSNQGSHPHFYEEPMEESLNEEPQTPEILPESIKEEKSEKPPPQKHEKGHGQLEKTTKNLHEKVEKPEKHKQEKQTKSEKKPKKLNRAPKVKKTDRQERSEEQISVTVNNVTVIITDYIPKKVKKEKRTSTEASHVDNSDNSSISGGSNCNTEDLILDSHHHH